MTVRRSGLLAPILLLLCWAAHAELPKSVVERVKAATVYIEVTNTAEDGTEATSSGSGFVIDPAGLVVTNQHVIDNRIETGPQRSVPAATTTITVSFRHGTSRQQDYEAALLSQHRAADLALLQLPEGTYPTLEIGSSDDAVETATVYAAGHPLGLAEISLRTGTVTSKRTLDGFPYVEHSVNIQQGNSGGPLFDSGGAVIGVNVFMLRDDAGAIASFAITTETLHRFLDGELPAESEGDAGGSTRALLEALLDEAGLVYTPVEGEDGVYELPYENAKVYVSAVEGWIQFASFLGVLDDEVTTEERLGRARVMLRANYERLAGRFCLDGDGDLWIEQYVYQDDVGASSLRAYAGYLATLAGEWSTGDLHVGQLATIRTFCSFRQDDDEAHGPAEFPAIFEAAGLNYEDAGDEVYRLPYQNDVVLIGGPNGEWMVLQRYCSDTAEMSDEDKVALYEHVLSASYNYYVGKFGLDGDEGLWLEQDALLDGLSAPAVRQYADILAGISTSFDNGEL